MLKDWAVVEVLELLFPQAANNRTDEIAKLAKRPFFIFALLCEKMFY